MAKLKRGAEVRFIGFVNGNRRGISSWDCPVAGAIGTINDINGTDVPYKIQFAHTSRSWWYSAGAVELIDNETEDNMKGSTMHNDRKVLLINEDIKVIRSAYEAGEDASTNEFKTFNAGLAVGDLILVPTGTRHKLVVNKVMEVGIKADWESSQPLPWVAGSINLAEHEHCLAQEASILDAMKDADKNKRAKEIVQAMEESVEDGVLRITAAPVKSDEDIPF